MSAMADSDVAIIDSSSVAVQSVAHFGTKVTHGLQTTVSSLGHTRSSADHQSAPDVVLAEVLLKSIGAAVSMGAVGSMSMGVPAVKIAALPTFLDPVSQRWLLFWKSVSAWMKKQKMPTGGERGQSDWSTKWAKNVAK
jgi:hypothetical protein